MVTPRGYGFLAMDSRQYLHFGQTENIWLKSSVGRKEGDLLSTRKESSENGLRTLPASHYSQAHSGIEDYELEAKVTLRFSGTLDDLYEGSMAQ